MNARAVIADQTVTMQRLKDRIADLERELHAAYVALTRAHVCDEASAR